MNVLDPADALQVGLYRLLTGGALGPALKALPTGLVSAVWTAETALYLAPVGAAVAIYDGVPEDAALPYAVIGEIFSSSDGTHSSHGRQTGTTIHSWTRADSHRPGNQIAARVVALLTAGDLDPLVAGHKVWRVEHEYAQTLIDPEPGIRHRVDRLRIWTSQEA